jgi:hypothetical protein
MLLVTRVNVRFSCDIKLQTDMWIGTELGFDITKSKGDVL